MQIKQPHTIIHALIAPDKYFPGNKRFPLLIYRGVFDASQVSADAVKALLDKNDWKQAWVDSIYNHHHYHSNTHEVLVVISGECEAQLGGEQGQVYTVYPGDVIILPAGVAHRSVRMSQDFQCVGAYPFDVEYDINHGHSDEYSKAIKNIQGAELPAKDPIFGAKGLLFEYWK